MSRKDITAVSNNTFTNNNTVKWIQSGKNYFETIEKLIRNSRYEIHLQTYIFASDKTGIAIADALLEAASRGVRVYVLVDAIGSQNLTAKMQKQMTDAGILVVRFGNLFSGGRFHIGRRLHRKVMVFDGYTSVVGGINISDNYNDTDNSPAWLDFAVIIEGGVSQKLQAICHRHWRTEKTRSLKFPVRETSAKANVPIRIRLNDFVNNRKEVTSTYFRAFRKSKESLLIVGGYFLPGGRSRRLFKNAIRRGVEISVLVAEKSDVGMVLSARRYLYGWLVRNKIRVFEYRNSNVHGKVLIADHHLCSIGSYDINNLSTYTNIELNVDIDDIQFVQGLEARIRHILKNESVEITEQYIEKTGTWNKIKRWIAYRLVKTFFFLSFHLAGKAEKDY